MSADWCWKEATSSKNFTLKWFLTTNGSIVFQVPVQKPDGLLFGEWLAGFSRPIWWLFYHFVWFFWMDKWTSPSLIVFVKGNTSLPKCELSVQTNQTKPQSKWRGLKMDAHRIHAHTEGYLAAIYIFLHPLHHMDTLLSWKPPEAWQRTVWWARTNGATLEATLLQMATPCVPEEHIWRALEAQMAREQWALMVVRLGSFSDLRVKFWVGLGIMGLVGSILTL